MPKIAGKTYVEPDRVLEMVRKAGLETEKLSSFYKVRGAGNRRVYIPLTKGVGRLDLSGFVMPAGTTGIIDLDEDAAFGGVHQQVEFEGRTEAEVMRTLAAVLKELKAGERKGARSKTVERRAPQRAPSTRMGRQVSRVANA